MLFFPKIALFHINCYFIGTVSLMYGFVAGLSSPESIFAEKNTYFQNRKYLENFDLKSKMKLHARILSNKTLRKYEIC